MTPAILLGPNFLSPLQRKIDWKTSCSRTLSQSVHLQLPCSVMKKSILLSFVTSI